MARFIYHGTYDYLTVAQTIVHKLRIDVELYFLDDRFFVSHGSVSLPREAGAALTSNLKTALHTPLDDEEELDGPIELFQEIVHATHGGRRNQLRLATAKVFQEHVSDFLNETEVPYDSILRIFKKVPELAAEAVIRCADLAPSGQSLSDMPSSRAAAQVTRSGVEFMRRASQHIEVRVNTMIRPSSEFSLMDELNEDPKGNDDISEAANKAANEAAREAASSRSDA
ncbi:hypothetical protein PRZ48_007406 [Zasmidium cellare]|uniref:Uncharacterized protein n=1 Tax=Zasmidium cellare TaxID=395010 RepID=A0ABR0EJH1_ZASCE|nr:hypothetical protein PRZ48_007406 [Zasmidium cellare]